MKRLILLLLLATASAQVKQSLSGTGGAGGTAGYQTSASVFTVTTFSLPQAPANLSYSQTLTSANGTAPISWNVILGSLPPGLTLASATGVISGTPTTLGNYTFTILATDSSTPTAKLASQQLTIQVTCAQLQILNQSPLPPVTVGTADNIQFSSQGGFGSVAWANSGGGIPTGTSLSSGGLLSGNPSAAGQFNFNISATDSCPTPQVVTNPFSQQVNNALTITTSSPLPNGTRGSPYSVQLSASGGTAPYTWLQTAGTLPAGLSLSSAGVLSGTPANAESDTFTAQVTDVVPSTNNKQFQITVSCPPLTIGSAAALPTASQGQPYSQQLQSSGGSGTVTWSILSGSLDPGLTLSPSGLISGTPTSSNSYTALIQAQDSCSPTPQDTTQTFTLTVVPQLAITTTSLPGAVQGTPYSATVAATGGQPIYTWSVPSGPIPSGAVDVLDYMLMKLPDRNSFHMAGGSNPHYSVLNGGAVWEIKGSTGNPWDIWWYDANYVYFAYTENNDSSQQAACIAAGYASCFVDPFAYKTPQQSVIFIPRYMIPGQVYTFMTPTVLTAGNVNPMTRTTNCGQDVQPPVYLGNRKVVGSISLTPTNWGGSVGLAITLEADHYYSGDVTGVYQSRERFFYALGFGRVNWDFATWNGTSYVVSQSSLNNNKVGGGAPSPNFACTLPNENTTPVPNLAGILPTGVPIPSAASLNLVDSTGAITGTPNTSGTFSFNTQVEDSSGNITQQPLSIVVTCGQTLTLTSSSPLPQGTISQPYSFQFARTGGVSPFKWQLIAGALPNGLTLSAGGLLAGTPTQTGTFSFTVQVLDGCNPNQQSAQKPFTLAIAAAGGALTVATPSPLPGGVEQVSYSQNNTATGGTPPYTWSVASGTLPAGLTQNSAGLISGTPTAIGTSTWTARVTDAISGTATKSLSLTVTCPALAFVSSSPLPPGTAGQSYSFQFSTSGGIPAVTYSATGVPAGLTLSSSGLLFGTPATVATSSISVTATDHCSPTPQTVGPTAFSLTVSAAIPPVTIASTSPLPQGVEGQAYSDQLSATGGVPPYNWTITSGSLQVGLTMNAAGLISGTPATVSTVSPTFKVTDTVGDNASATLSLTTVCPSFNFTSTSPLPVATQNSAYSYQFTSTGGFGTITWTATGVPTGLSLSTGGLLSGTPTVAATNTINVTATDSCSTPQVIGPTGYTLVVNPAPNPLSIITPSPLPSATQNVAYSTTLAATGGAPPYGSWTVTVGTLPTGLTLHSATGVIDGTPTVVGTSSFTVQVSDSVPNTATKAFQLTVAAPSTADNRYCNTNETTNFTPPTDDPATLPQTCVRTALADTPASGPTKTVCASGCDFTTLQAAWNAASSGWIIQLKSATGGVQNVYAGATPTVSGTPTNWIWIESDQVASLPPEGSRISPAYAGHPTLVGRPPYSQPATTGVYMPKIRGGNNTLNLNNLHNVRFIGVELTSTSGATTSNIVNISGSNHIIFDRIVCHGGDSPTGQDKDTVTRCGAVNSSTYVAVVDSYHYDFHCQNNSICADSHPWLFGGNSASAEGPFKYVDFFSEAAGECWFNGGGGAGTSSATPVDFEIRRGHCFKPLFWKTNDPTYFGTSFEVKNNGELKNANRVLIEGVIFDTTWTGQADQKGFQLVLGVKNQSSSFSGTASSNGAGTITWLTGTHFSTAQIANTCAVPGHCKFRYNGINYQVQTFIDTSHITVCCGPPANPLPPTSASSSFLAFVAGLNPNAQLRNVTVRYNQFTHSTNGMEVFLALSDGGDVGLGESNISIHDDQFDDVDGPHWSTSNGACCAWSDIFQITNAATISQGNLHDVTIRHVTGLSRLTNGSAGFGPGIAFVDQTATGSTIGNLRIFDNLFAAGIPRDVKGVCTNGTDATSVLNCIGALGGTGPASYCFDHNALATTTATTGAPTTTSNNPPYPTASPNCTFTVSGNFLAASYDAMKFTNLNGAIGGNYQLLSTSLYRNVASDGTDLGANVPAVNAAVAGVQ